LKERPNVLRAAALFAVVTVTMTGCAGLSASPQKDTYELTSVAPVPGPYSRKRQIVVTDPAALRSLDGTDIVVRTSPSLIQYLAASQWNDNLPAVIQEKLVQAFEDSDRLGGVGKPGDGIAVDYLLSSTVRAFEIETGGAAAARVEISVRLIDDRNGVIKAQQVFRATWPVSGSSAEAFISALDRAHAAVIREIVAWTLQRV